MGKHSAGELTALGNSLADHPPNTPTTAFHTFPVPEGLTPDTPADRYAIDVRAIVIAQAARRLVQLRDRWLNPPEWLDWIDEPLPSYPKRPVPKRFVPRQ